MGDNDGVPAVPLNMILLEYRLMLAALPELGELFGDDEKTQVAITAQVQAEAQRAEQEQRDREEAERLLQEENLRRQQEENEKREKEDAEKREKEEAAELLAREGFRGMTPQELLTVMEHLYKEKNSNHSAGTTTDGGSGDILGGRTGTRAKDHRQDLNLDRRKVRRNA